MFEDHLIYADEVASYRKFMPKIQVLRDMQRRFQEHAGVQSYHAKDGRSPGICHQVAREKLIEPGDFIQATDSHTCMGGGSNAYAYGVGATEYAALVLSGVTSVVVPQSIRFELTGRLRPGVTAKDVMLYILMTAAKQRQTLDRCMEFGGPGLASLSMDERATLANMATECTAKAGVVEADEATLDWIAERRPDLTRAQLRAKVVKPDPGAVYEGGVHPIDLGSIRPMVAHPGDPDRGIPSDPTNGEAVPLTRPSSYGSQWWSTSNSVDVEYLLYPNEVYEDMNPSAVAETLESSLDTLMDLRGSNLANTGATYEPVTMTWYHGVNSPNFVFSGFPVWAWRRSDVQMLFDFVLQQIWGLSKSTAPSSPSYRASTNPFRAVSSPTNPSAAGSAMPVRRGGGM